MSRFWDAWATSHRNWRAIYTAAGFLFILLWAGIEIRSSRLVDSTKETAIVLEIRTHSTASSFAGREEPGGPAMCTGRLMLADSTTVELMLFSPLPDVGDRMPVIVERYNNGKTYYSVDHQDWQMNGPR